MYRGCIFRQDLLPDLSRLNFDSIHEEEAGRVSDEETYFFSLCIPPQRDVNAVALFLMKSKDGG